MPTAPGPQAPVYARAPEGRPRLAFVGPGPLFEACTPSAPTSIIDSRFFDFRGETPEELLGDLHRYSPHVVVCFRPEHLPSGLLAGLPAAVLGVAAEPLPRGEHPTNEGLQWNLGELAKADARSFDRVVVCDPLGFDAAAAHLPAWRSQPLPVDDRLFRPLRPSRRPPRAIFVGHSTMHVEQFLLPVKHGFDIGHYAHGLAGDLLEEVLESADIGINVHPDGQIAALAPRVLMHLAAGHLVLSEPLERPFALEPDIDFVVVASSSELDTRMHQLSQRPDAYDRVRIRGRAKVEQYRASRVWRALVDDLFDDLAAFGTERDLR
jgi:hypothetical protein